MIKKGSRYEKARGFVYSGEVSSPFRGTRPREIGRATGVVELGTSGGVVQGTKILSGCIP